MKIECETNSFYTFHQLANDSRRAANIWLGLGLKEGDIFGVVGQNCYQYLTLYLGGIIAGGIASGLRTNETFRESFASMQIFQRIQFNEKIF